MRNNTSFQH